MTAFAGGFRRQAAAFAGMVLAVFPLVSPAAETLYAVVERDGNEYLVEFLVRLNTPVERVRALVDDYARFPALSPTILESEVLARREDGSVRLRIVLRPCVLVFCRRIVKTSEVTRMPAGELRYVADARASDFHAAIEWLWVMAGEADLHRLSPAAKRPSSPGATTLVRYRAHLMPRFFVPPLIGPWLVRRQILQELTVVAERVEALAR